MTENILGITHYREGDLNNILYEHISPDYSHKLSLIRNWRRNRPPDMLRVQAITNGIIERGYCDGELYLAIHPSLGCVCYDGNHRLEAARKSFPKYGLRVRIWFVENESDIESEFIRINKGVPVPELYFSKDETDSIIRSNLELFIGNILLTDSRIKDHISTSRTPKRPNFNKDVLFEQIGDYIRDFYTEKNNLTEADIHKTISPTFLMDWFNDMNEYARNEIENSGDSNKMIEKCRKSQWFLFYFNWLTMIAPNVKIYIP